MALNAGTYEAQVIELLGDRGDVIYYTVADATTISKGTVCKFYDPRTAIRSTTGYYNIQQPVAGIASADKEANDGSTKLGFYTNGVFEMRVDSNADISAGDAVTVSGANNQIVQATAGAAISGAILGVALEDGTANEEIAVRVRVR